MDKPIAYRREGYLWVVMGVTVLMAHAGCLNRSGFPPGGSDGGRDSGARDGKATAVESGAGKETRMDLATVDSAGAGTGGAATGGSGGAAGSGGTGGTTSTSTSPGDAAVSDAPQPPPPGGTGGSAGSGSGGMAGSGGSADRGGSNGGGGSGGSGTAGRSGGTGGGGGGGSTQPPPDGAVRDGALDYPVDRAPDTTADAPGCASASSCPAPTSGNGTAVCQNGVCGITCNSGYHRCGNTCALSTSVATCGTACSACPAGPSGATATCSGNPLACGFTCNTGYHRCGNACVANGSTDLNSCGNNCSVCQAPDHGTVTCNGTTCVSSCNPAYHQCGSLCLSNSSSGSCGSRCTACPVPAHSSPNCTGSNPVCGIYCDTNYHQCDNKCIINTDPNNCGPNCSICPGDDNGTAICTGTPGTCGITCKNGFHWCDNVKKCVDNTAAATCGNRCQPCPADPGYVATCSATTLTCGQKLAPCTDPGSHICGNPPACVAENVDSCGDSCIACPGGGTTVPNSSPVCSNGVCGLVCNSTFHDCRPDGAKSPNCVPNDASACGSACMLCLVPPANGRAICDNGTTCAVTCDTGFHQCGTSDSPTCIGNSSTSLDSCGMTCEPCPKPSDPSTIVATCDGTKCGLSCIDSSYHLCNDTCFQNDDATHCGTGDGTCVACSSDQVCTDGKCAAAPPSPDAAVAPDAH